MDFTDFQTIPGGFKLIADGPGGCEFRFRHGQKQLKTWGDTRVILISCGAQRDKPKRRKKRRTKENHLQERRETA